MKIIKNKDQQIAELTARVAALEDQLRLKDEIISALLTKIYGVKSEKMSSDQMLLAFLEEDAKKPEAADPEDQGPAAKQTTKKKRAKRTNKLIDSLEGLPTNERTITDPEVIASPDLFRLLGEEISIRLLPLYRFISGQLRQSSYLKADETPIDCLEPGKGKTSFTGYLQSDGLRAYRTFRERHHDLKIIPVSCLAHIRRKFWEARKDHPKITAWILLLIGKIYDIERKLKKQNATDLERQKIRGHQTRLHYDRLRRLIHHLHHKTKSILPQSKLGKALAYAIDQWDHLEPCFLDGQIEIDNNHTEGAIRPTKLGAKNWMFIGAEETGWRSAVIYTFIEQIRRHGMDPQAYLEWVFEKLMHNPSEDELEALLPTNWVAAQRRAVENRQTPAA